MLGPVFNDFLALSAVLVLAIAVQRRFAAGYAPAPSGLAVLHRGEAAFIQAAAEVLFPDGNGGWRVGQTLTTGPAPRSSSPDRGPIRASP